MSVATAISDLSARIQKAFDACEAKGAAMPAQKTTYTLSSTIDGIPAGSEYYGIPDARCAVGIVSSGVLSYTGDTRFGLDISGATEAAPETLDYRFANNKFLSSVNLPDLESGTFISAFAGCENLISVSLPKLKQTNGLRYAFFGAGVKRLSFPAIETVSGQNAMTYAFGGSKIESVEFPALVALQNGYCMSYAFANCTALTSVSFPELSIMLDATSLQYAFNGCAALSSIEFPKLAEINSQSFSYAFQNCTALTGVSFPELTAIPGNSFSRAFNGCTNLSSVSFPKAVSIIAGGNALQATFNSCNYLQEIMFPQVTSIVNNYVFSNCANLTAIHFGAENETAVKALGGYSSKWGAPNADCQILFDL